MYGAAARAARLAQLCQVQQVGELVGDRLVVEVVPQHGGVQRDARLLDQPVQDAQRQHGEARGRRRAALDGVLLVASSRGARMAALPEDALVAVARRVVGRLPARQIRVRVGAKARARARARVRARARARARARVRWEVKV